MPYLRRTSQWSGQAERSRASSVSSASAAFSRVQFAHINLNSTSGTFPLLDSFHSCCLFLTSLWLFLRQRRSSFRDSTWASRSDLHRVSSPRIPRRPLMSFSTSWRRDSSLSYLTQQERYVQCCFPTHRVSAGCTGGLTHRLKEAACCHLFCVWNNYKFELLEYFSLKNII